MKIKLIGLLSLYLILNLNASIAQEVHPLVGKWDLKVSKDGKELPSWLEVKVSGVNTFVGKFVYAFGSARPISEIKVSGNSFTFSIPRQWEPEGTDMIFSGTVMGDKINGNMIYTDAKSYAFQGEPAKKVRHIDDPSLGKEMVLFNGKDLIGWHVDGAKEQWKVDNGILINPEAGSNLITDKSFTNFNLKMEFRYPEGSNSGLYLRGRYEVQIADNKGMEPSNILFGGIYGFLTPNEMVAKGPGEWQSYDITLNGNRVSIIANGKAIITDQIIPGITGGAIDSDEGNPGPIMLQGDHGPIEFRKIVLTPLLE